MYIYIYASVFYLPDCVSIVVVLFGVYMYIYYIYVYVCNKYIIYTYIHVCGTACM